jgi:hypothetical protein
VAFVPRRQSFQLIDRPVRVADVVMLVGMDDEFRLDALVSRGDVELFGLARRAAPVLATGRHQ